MAAVSSIALSGMNAALLHLGAAGHNIANAQTAAFRRQVVAQEALPEGGVRASVAPAPGDGASLADDVVDQVVSVYAFKANLHTLRAEQRMLGSLLDTTA